VAHGRDELNYMVECFWPDVRRETVDEASRRIRESAADLTRAGTEVALTGAILVPDDDVVFYLFNGSADAVRQACQRGEIDFARVVHAVELDATIAE
jgi:hypothetical protein